MGPIGLGNRFQPTIIMRWDRGIFNGSSGTRRSVRFFLVCDVDFVGKRLDDMGFRWKKNRCALNWSQNP